MMLVVAHAQSDEERAQLAYERARARLLILTDKFRRVGGTEVERFDVAWALTVARGAMWHAARVLLCAKLRHAIFYQAHCRKMRHMFVN
jgi:hypothetical protein